MRALSTTEVLQITGGYTLGLINLGKTVTPVFMIGALVSVSFTMMLNSYWPTFLGLSLTGIYVGKQIYEQSVNTTEQPMCHQVNVTMSELLNVNNF